MRSGISTPSSLLAEIEVMGCGEDERTRKSTLSQFPFRVLAPISFFLSGLSAPEFSPLHDSGWCTKGSLIWGEKRHSMMLWRAISIASTKL